MPHKLYADQIQTQNATPEPLQMPDNRIVAVQGFLDSKKCASSTEDFATATVFVDQADKNNIDPYILPVVWWKESQCGKHQKNGDGFGWMSSSGLYPFPDLTTAITYISAHLATHPYAGKSLSGIVGTYNNHPEYLVSFMGYYNWITNEKTLLDNVDNSVLVK